MSNTFTEWDKGYRTQDTGLDIGHGKNDIGYQTVEFVKFRKKFKLLSPHSFLLFTHVTKIHWKL